MLSQIFGKFELIYNTYSNTKDYLVCGTSHPTGIREPVMSFCSNSPTQQPHWRELIEANLELLRLCDVNETLYVILRHKHHSKSLFILHRNCVTLQHCTFLHRNCDVTVLRCLMKVTFILTCNAVKLQWHNPNTIKSYKILQKLSPKHAAHGVAQSTYPN